MNTDQKINAHIAARADAVLNISIAVQKMARPKDIFQALETSLAELEKTDIDIHSLSIQTIVDAQNGIVKIYHIDGNGVIKAGEESTRAGLVSRWQTQTPLYEPDIEKTRDKKWIHYFRKHAGNQRIISFVHVPFSQGTLAVYSLSPYAFAPWAIETFTQIAEILSLGLSRVQDLVALEEQKQVLEESDRLLTAYHQIGQLLLASLDEDQIIDRLVTFILDAGLFRSMTIGLVNEQAQMLHVLRSKQSNEGQITSNEKLASYHLTSPDIMAEVVRTGNIEIIEGWDAARFTNHKNQPLDELIELYRDTVGYFIPLKRGNKVIGVLATGSTHAQRPAILHRIEMMSPLLDQVVVALEHARLYGEITERTRNQNALLSISKATQEMSKPADISIVMQVCLNQLQELGICADGIALHQITDAAQGTIKTFRALKKKVIGETTESGRHGLVKRWQNKRLFYVKDLDDRELGYPEGLRKRFNGAPIMSFVDIPFSGGIFTLLSLKKDAFPNRIQPLLLDIVTLLAIGLVRLEDLERVETQNQAVYKLNTDLEQRIEEGISDLKAANQRLQNEILVRQDAEDALQRNNALLNGLRRAQSQYIEKVDTQALFEELLQSLLALTSSEYGFIGEVLHTLDNKPYLKTWSITNIAWNDETQTFYDKNVSQGLEFFNLKSLFGSVLTTEEPVIANTPSTDPRRAGLPKGHPPLNAFLGIPFFSADKIVGMVGIANREGGYDQSIIDFLEPFLVTCGVLMEANRTDQRRQEAEEALEKSEEKLRQTQKMEAIGKLAGGVAHDFNNVLTVINGYSMILLKDLPDADPNRELVEEIQKAGTRAAGLTQQLLTFSRRQVMQTEVFDLNAVTTNLQKMLRHLIGEDIHLNVLLHAKSSLVEADQSQLEQVILNLAINARDAMPLGGTLTIEVANITLSANQTDQWEDIRPGPYVMFSLTDTGIGMSVEVQNQIFEPFFTTKEKDKGTGLGLATVYGIVTQSGGYIQVQSEEDKGTTFYIYLPQIESNATKEPDIPQLVQTLTGTETVLLVEDERQVRTWIHKTLSNYGYTVIDADDGETALDLWKHNANAIDLLLTDVVMPHLNGKDLADQLKHDRPNLKVLFVSGYTDDALSQHGVLNPDTQLLSKPFSPEDLLASLRSLLDDQ